MDWSLIWQAATAIGTILVVITALFSIKWQDKINNKKEMKIIWMHGDGIKAMIATDKAKEKYPFKYVILEFANTGNRIIIIKNFVFKFKNKSSAFLPKFADKFPVRLTKEDILLINIQIDEFYEIVRSSLDSGNCVANEEVVIVAEDSVGKTYRLSTGISFDFYVKYYEHLLKNASRVEDCFE
ncbi:hypothetical protein R83H12_00402 [Fibrobacteria bacterium R8-3-H12]